MKVKPLRHPVRPQHVRRDPRLSVRCTERERIGHETDATDSELQLLARYGQNDCVIAVGRRAWLFIDTQLGALASANLYSLAITCRANGINALAYFTYLYEHLPLATTAVELEALLPWNVKPLLAARDTRIAWR